MPKLKQASIKLFLKTPILIKRNAIRIGIGRQIFGIHDRLYRSECLQSMPCRMREARIEQLMTRYFKKSDIGSSISGFYPFMIPANNWKCFPDIQYMEGAAPAETLYAVISSKSENLQERSLSMGLHIHAYYLDGLPDLLARIQKNRTIPDIFVTGSVLNQRAVEDILSQYAGSAQFIPCENIGRDVVPFLSTLPIMLSNHYDLLGHVHIKKSIGGNSNHYVQHWSEYLLSSIIGDNFGKNASIDAIASDYIKTNAGTSIYVPHLMDPVGWGSNREIAQDIYSKIAKGVLPDRFVFSVGTMFWAKPSYLFPFSTINLNWSDLAKEPLPRDGTVLHAIERILGAHALASDQKMSIMPLPDNPFVFSEKIMNFI